MESACQTEVDRLHRFFVDWFTARLDQQADILDRECGSYFSDDFTMVTPSGTLLAKPALMQGDSFEATGVVLLLLRLKLISGTAKSCKNTKLM